MGVVQFTNTGLQGLMLIEPMVYKDNRGYFFEAYNSKDFRKAGLPEAFVQDNESLSVKGTIRGLHFQLHHPQAKLVRVTFGEIYDVAVDIRPESDTFGQWYGIILSDTNHLQLYIPEGFAHGFLTLSDIAVVCYKCSKHYKSEGQMGIIWNDPDISINWPIEKTSDIIISEKDDNLHSFSYVKEYLVNRG